MIYTFTSKLFESLWEQNSVSKTTTLYLPRTAKQMTCYKWLAFHRTSGSSTEEKTRFLFVNNREISENQQHKDPKSGG
ncbi:hypothetical protein KY290_020570 [Solanum tuberosum]|uniref:Uncharacterized protein n=1 Tax=Solanum tuberosum TaxID=4113 RepID=A0ABQ7UZ18_SOLTU|nr:hypothetical protein KY290_020570 [Solanum tuberosum]